jgi:AcrR family transcriptional regulator
VDLKPEETPSTRRRGEALESAILEAAWEVLSESGYQGFTYEAVAARAGTSRPVLYRRWPQRDDLLQATLKAYWSARPIEVPDTGSLREDVLTLLRRANDARGRLLAMISVQLMEYFRSTGTSFSQMREMLIAPGSPTGLERIVARAVERGELADVPRSSRAVNVAFDLFRHELFMTMREVPDAALEDMVDEVYLPLLRSVHPREGSRRAPSLGEDRAK